MKQKIEGGCEEKHFWKQGEKGDFCICGKPFFDDIHSNPETKRAGSAVIFVCPKCEYPEELCHCISPEELQKIKASERQRCVEEARTKIRRELTPIDDKTEWRRGATDALKQVDRILSKIQVKHNLEQLK